MLYLRLARPAVDVDLDAPAPHTFAKEDVGKIVSAMEDNECVCLRIWAHASLQVVEQVQAKVGRTGVPAMDVSDAWCEHLQWEVRINLEREKSRSTQYDTHIDLQFQKEPLCLLRPGESALVHRPDALFSSHDPAQFDFNGHAQLRCSLAVRLGHGDVFLIGVVVAAVDHHRVHLHALLGPVEHPGDVFVRPGVVDVHRDGHRGRMAGFQDKASEVYAKLIKEEISPGEQAANRMTPRSLLASLSRETAGPLPAIAPFLLP